MGARRYNRPAALRVPTLFFQEGRRQTWWMQAKGAWGQAKGAWEELLLIASEKLELELPGPRTYTLHRHWPSGRALNGQVISSFAGRTAFHLARARGLNARIVATELLWESEFSVVWRGTIGSKTVIVKTDRKDTSDECSTINHEYGTLAQHLPKDPAKASELPIPDYYGMFKTVQGGEALRASVMSDGGPSLEELGELGLQLR